MDKATALKVVITAFCKEIGCSMMSPKRCPGDPLCNIPRKAMPWIAKVERELSKDEMEAFNA